MAPEPEKRTKPRVSFDTGEKAYKGKAVVCPHCGEEVLINFSVDICQVSQVPVAGPKQAIDRWKASLPPEQAAAIDAAKRSGLFESFEFAWRNVSSGRPKQVEKFFLEWFKLCRPREIPAWAMKEFKGLYPGKRIEFYAHAQVGAVIAMDVVSLFVPIEVITGTRVDTAIAGESKIIPGDVKGIQQWVRTKMGYVPLGAHVMIAQMRKRCIGEFARPLL